MQSSFEYGRNPILLPAVVKVISYFLGAAAVATGGAARILMEITNPDPSKDAQEAHQEKVEEKQKQVPQDPPREPYFFEKLND